MRTIEAAGKLKDTLDTYRDVSGQEINFAKSNFAVSPNTPTNIRMAFSRVFNIQFVVGMGRYLGLNLDFSENKYQMFAKLKSRISRHIGKWRSSNLSVMGRIVLAKHVLSALS